MMTSLDGASTITTIVEAMLPCGGSRPENAGDPSKALHISVHFSLRSYDDDNERLEHRFVHLIFERPTNYTKVWAAQSNSYFLPKPSDFEMLADHDSGWRSAFDSYLFQVWQNLRDRFEGIPQNKVHARNTVEQINWCEAKYQPDPADTRGYRQVLTHLLEVC